MLKRLSSREVLINLASEWEAALAREWLDAIRSITSAVTLQALIAELERGNLDAAMRLLNIDADRFARFEAGILSAYNAGGIATVGSMPALRDPSGARVNFTWGVRNLPAEQAMRQHAASLVDDLVGEQLTVARSVLVDGLSRGQNPRQTALGLVGRVNRRSGFREGGVLGLTPSSVQTLDKIYGGLRAGDAQAMRDYLGYQLRDKRFDGHVHRALEQGGSVPAEAVDRIVTAYSNRALKYRADNLALTETNIALAKAKTDAFQQQIDAGKLDAQDLTKTWQRTVSRAPRDGHLAMVGKTIPFGEMFTLPSGHQCTGPHDPNLPASEIVNCKCLLELSVDFTAQALRKYRARTGG
ncbi:head morphogenesis protein [Devosia honganensis]|uniref:Head morphogenesis protein n=1 Tax=Devosia honganensis TaxID=1610527 RepID=A0ABV7X1P8_9HYPH